MSDGNDPHDDERPHGWDLFRMSDVVDEIKRTAPDVVAYVEQTGGGCATIYAAMRRWSNADDPVLYQHPSEPGYGRYPVMAGPGTFDWHGGLHEASLADFHIGADPDLVQTTSPGVSGEYAATAEDTVQTLAARIVQMAREFTATEPGVLVWPGR